MNNKEYFFKMYGHSPYYLFARDVVGGRLKDQNAGIESGFKLLKELEDYFIKSDCMAKAGNVRDFRNKWKDELKKEFHKN